MSRRKPSQRSTDATRRATSWNSPLLVSSPPTTTSTTHAHQVRRTFLPRTSRAAVHAEPVVGQRITDPRRATRRRARDRSADLGPESARLAAIRSARPPRAQRLAAQWISARNRIASRPLEVGDDVDVRGHAGADLGQRACFRPATSSLSRPTPIRQIRGSRCASVGLRAARACG